LTAAAADRRELMPLLGDVPGDREAEHSTLGSHECGWPLRRLWVPHHRHGYRLTRWCTWEWFCGRRLRGCRLSTCPRCGRQVDVATFRSEP
jgi:hypothetical protein